MNKESQGNPITLKHNLVLELNDAQQRIGIYYLGNLMQRQHGPELFILMIIILQIVGLSEELYFPDLPLESNISG